MVKSWDWIRLHALRMAGCLIFVRAVTPERVIEGFRMDPAEAMLLPEARVGRRSGFPLAMNMAGR